MIFDTKTAPQLARNISFMMQDRQNSHSNAIETALIELIGQLKPNGGSYYSKTHGSIAATYSETYYFTITADNQSEYPYIRLRMKFLGCDRYLVDKFIDFKSATAFNNVAGRILASLRDSNAHNHYQHPIAEA